MQNSLRKAFFYRNVAGIIAETELIKMPLHMLTLTQYMPLIARLQ